MTKSETVTKNVTETNTAAPVPATTETAPDYRGKPALLARCHDLTAFASTDATRFVLQGVHFNADKRRVEATDGKMVIRVPVLENIADFPPVADKAVDSESVIVPVKALRKALGNACAKSALPVLETVRLSAAVNGHGCPKATLTATDLETEQATIVKAIDGNYPDVDQVWPTEAPAFSITLAASILRRLAEYADKHGVLTGSEVAVRFDFTDNMAPVRASFLVAAPGGERLNAEACLMPMRAS